MEPNIEFIVVFSGRLGVRLMMTNKKTGGRLERREVEFRGEINV